MKYDLLNSVNKEVGTDVRLVLSGTDGSDNGHYIKCIERGITKVNINKFTKKRYMDLQNGNNGKLGLTIWMEKGTDVMQEAMKECVDMLGSNRKA